MLRLPGILACLVLTQGCSQFDLRKDIPLIELNENINDPGFAESCARSLLHLMESE